MPSGLEGSCASTVDGAVELIGFGHFQVFVMMICGMGWFAASIGTNCLPLVYVTLDEEWGTSTTDWGVLQSAKDFSSVMGVLLFGVLADRFGRRTAFLTSLFTCVLGGIFSMGAWSFTSLVFFRGFTEFGAGGILPTSITLVAEHLPMSMRDFGVALMNIFFQAGHMFAVVLWMVLPDTTGMWRVFLGAMALPPCLLLCMWPVIPESPEWLYQSGSVVRAQDALAKMYRWNGTSKSLHVRLDRSHAPSDEAPEIEDSGISHLFSSAQLAKQTLLFGMLWFFAMSGSDFSVWVTELGHNHDISQEHIRVCLLVYKCITVSVLIVAPVLGRGKKAYRIFKALCGATAFFAAASTYIITTEINIVAMIVAGGALFVSYDLTWAFMYAITASAFAPRCRASALSVAHCFSRVSASIVPLATGVLMKNSEYVALLFWTMGWILATVVSTLHVPDEELDVRTTSMRRSRGEADLPL